VPPLVVEHNLPDFSLSTTGLEDLFIDYNLFRKRGLEAI
jgi:hypothetical protein